MVAAGNRVAGRVVVLDRDGCVLLLRGHDPSEPERGAFWFTPGGGCDAGETPADAARRELFEETGLALDELGPARFERRTDFDFEGVHYRQREHFFCVMVDRFDLDDRGWTDIERRSVTGHRWWGRDDIALATETVYPENLGELLDRFDPRPPTLVFDGETTLRRWRVDDAEVVARAVRENLEHLRPWMPWATEESTRVEFQRGRLPGVVRGYDDLTGSWEYAICTPDDEVIGSCGIARRDDGRIEIGYWVHVDHVGRGHASRATGMLTTMWRDRRHEARIEIRCDETNHRSAAVPRRLGYRLDRVIDEPALAPAETGRTSIWVLDRDG